MKINRNIDIALLLLRITFGAAMIIGHGWGKLQRLFGAEEITFADPFGLGPVVSLVLVVFAEVLCSVLIILGLFTRWATIPLIITMLTAFFMVHFDDPFNRQEKAILYVITYICLLLTGAGYYSLDRLIRKNSV